MTYNEKLVKLRKEHGFTQEQLAEMIGVSRQAISRWEAGETVPEAALLIRLCDVYHVSADYLLRDEYQSDDDAPAVVRKAEELADVSGQRARARQIALVFGVFALCGAVWGIVLSETPIQLAASCFFAALLAGVTAWQLVLAVKEKRK